MENSFQPAVRKKMMKIRSFIFDVARETEGVGELEETLKWGQPSYLPQNLKLAAPFESVGKRRLMGTTRSTSNARRHWSPHSGSAIKANLDLRVIGLFFSILEIKSQFANYANASRWHSLTI